MSGPSLSWRKEIPVSAIRLSALALAGAGFALAAAPGAAEAQNIFTAGATGAYHTTFCPILEKELAKARFDYRCQTSDGTADNVARVAKAPYELAFGQLDVFALEVPKHGGARNFTRLRVDDARECVFAVTRNENVTNYGEIAAYANRLRMVIPPESSGSAGTFRFLQKIDPTGVGSAKEVIVATSTEDALRTALSTDDGVAFFVQYPDPKNPRFKMIQDLGGHVVPVIDRTILNQQIEDRKIYFAEETEVTNTRWLKAGRKVVTACTPIVVFTGNTNNVQGDRLKQDHKDLIATVVTFRSEEMLPKEGVFSKLIKKTRELSAASAAKVVEYTQDAREKAKPWVDKTKEATERAIEKARPAMERAKERGTKAYERAKEETKEFMDKVRPQDAPPPQKQ
jgi:hypothetical protein